MKRHPSLSEAMKRRLLSGPSRAREDRRGSTLLVVMGLLGMLTLLGLLYFTFASQEMQSSINFADAAKKNVEPSDDIEAIFNESIRQLILGGDYSQKNSVLWGGRHSLLGTLIGQRTALGQWDRQPYTGLGAGISLAAGYLNDSPAANNLQERNPAELPGADSDYMYPDLNTVLLAYQANTWDHTTTPPTRFPIPVVKPSWHRPELLRDNATNQPIRYWAVSLGDTVLGPGFPVKSSLFRPHPEHLYVWRQNTTVTPERRFIIDASSNPLGDPTLAGYIAADAPLIGAGPAQVTSAFPFLKDQDGDGNYAEQGVWSRMVIPPTPVNQFDAYDYDADTDGDGIPDAVWIDLDHPVLTRPSDNKKYVALIAMKVVDQDGLLNLNGVGGLAGETRVNATANFGNITNPFDPDISRSNMGLSPSEINPIWALDAVPGVDFTPPVAPNDYYVKYFAHNPLSGALWHQARESGNMEWWWLNKGRIDYLSPNVIHPGRLGEANRLWQVLSGGPNAISVQQTNSNLFPFPGVWDLDDNRDFNEGGQLLTAGLAAGQGLPFQHPLALNGLGRSWTGPKNLDLFQAVAANPSRWLRYTGMGVGEDGAGNGNVAWLNAFASALMVTPKIGATFAEPGGTPRLVDDMNELMVEPKYDPRPYDEPLEPKDTLLLSMTAADRASTGITSRVLDLMPGNFDVAAIGSSAYLSEIGKRFTTTSWDLKQFALTSNPIAGPRAWEWNVDVDGDWTTDTTPAGLEFPPQFNPVLTTQATANDPAYVPAHPGVNPNASLNRYENAYGYIHNGTNAIKQDPFRPQLRRLLETEFGNTSKPKLPMRLSLNEFLDVEHTPGAPLPKPFDNQNATAYPDYFRTRALQFRPLTPHSTDTLAADPTWGSPPALPAPFAPANVSNPLPAYPPQNEPEKEFWARRDRQQMARDVYVMLYTFCGGDATASQVTTAAGDVVYPVTGPANRQYDLRRQMAQFAVNVVDSLDRDNVITMFEYDRDLSNGWDLDDDVSTNDGGGNRGVVFGVEAQELTISEVMWLQQEQDTVTDNLQTPFNEMMGPFNFLQLELRSTSAFPVPLALPSSTGAGTGIWRIVRDDDTDGDLNRNMTTTENAVELLTGVGGTVAAPGDRLAPGSLFTIASSDPTPVGSAALYIDHTGGATDFELVAPNKAGVAPYTGAAILPADVAPDLDLLHSSHAGRFLLDSGAAGDLLSQMNNPGDADTNLVLQRRMNPHLPLLSLGANFYVTVDIYRGVARHELRFQGGPMMMNPPPVASQADAASRLSMIPPFDTPQLASQERRQPLAGNDVALCNAVVGPSPHLNTLSQTNQTIPGGGLFNLFQPHFDRDFASTIDLFHVYLVGPAGLTRSVRGGIQSPFTTAPFTFGQATILQAEVDADGDGMLSVTEDLNGNGELDSNHFHRLLSMVEVPTRTHRQLGDPLKINRVPARVNLNTVRDPRVLAAVIDDRQVIAPPEHTGADFNGNAVIDDGLLDLTGDAGRDWWFKFLEARDGQDSVSNLYLPGVLGLPLVSRPFRDVGNLTTIGGSPIEDTILRALPGTTVGRRLFELVREDNSEFQNAAIDPVMRHRLLSKMYGNTTTRSNTFMVFVTIGMFECIETTPAGATEPVIRIGGPLYQPAPAPPMTHVQYREAFILDRSEVEDAFDPGGTTFDWQKLIKARQRIN